VQFRTQGVSLLTRNDDISRWMVKELKVGGHTVSWPIRPGRHGGNKLVGHSNADVEWFRKGQKPGREVSKTICVGVVFVVCLLVCVVLVVWGGGRSKKSPIRGVKVGGSQLREAGNEAAYSAGGFTEQQVKGRGR